jgi:hypothetical protein
MPTSLVSAGAVNGNGTTPTNGTASTSGTADLITRGLALAAALASAPDVAINPPLDLPDHYPDEPPALDHDPAEAAEVFAEMDARQHLDLFRCLTLDQLIEHQIQFYEGWGNDAEKWFALHMTELLLKYRGAGSPATPAEAMARIEILEQDVRHDWEAIGYEAGKQAGRLEAVPFDGALD